MNTPELPHALRAARDAVQVNQPPTQDIVRRGRLSLRRSRLAHVSAAAVAAAALAMLGGQVLPTGEDGIPTYTDSSQTSSSENLPIAPAGMRLVGKSRVVVAVPQSWTTDGVGCDGHTAIENTVVFDAEGIRSCIVAKSGTPSSLHIVSTNSRWAKPWVEAQGTESSVDGVTVKRVDGGCDQSSPARCSGAVVVDAHQVVMYVLSQDPHVVATVLDSVQMLPKGYTTIPVDHSSPAATTIDLMREEAGLKVNVVEEDRPGLSDGVLLDTDPALGEAVRVGSTVTVTVSSPVQGL